MKSVKVKATTVAASAAVSAPVAEKEPKVSKMVIAANIVMNAYKAFADAVAAGKDPKELPTPRAAAIAEIQKQLYPGEESARACLTYYAHGYARALASHNEVALAAAEKGKAIFTVFNLNPKKDKAGTTSNVGYCTSATAAKQLCALLNADGYAETKLESGEVVPETAMVWAETRNGGRKLVRKNTLAAA